MMTPSHNGSVATNGSKSAERGLDLLHVFQLTLLLARSALECSRYFQLRRDVFPGWELLLVRALTFSCCWVARGRVPCLDAEPWAGMPVGGVPAPPGFFMPSAAAALGAVQQNAEAQCRSNRGQSPIPEDETLASKDGSKKTKGVWGW